MRSPRDEAQLQVLEAIIVAIFIFIAMAVVSIYRLPASPGTFQQSELLNLGVDAIKVRAAKVPSANADCNEPAPCPFANDWERMVSLAMGYVGRTVDGVPANEAPNSEELRAFLDQALPSGSRNAVYYSNGFNLTKLAPLNINPPGSDVVVARYVLAANWSVQSPHRAESVLMRVGERTTFDSVGLASIRDPLNRTSTEFGYPNKSLFATKVPDNSTLGTHMACYVTLCRYFTVVPAGVYGPGAQILPEDPTNSTKLVGFGTFVSKAKYYDANTNGQLDAPDKLYLPSGVGATVAAGDLRLSEVSNCRSGATCFAGSWVRAGDIDLAPPRALLPLPGAAVLRAHDQDLSGAYNVGDTVYLTQSDLAPTVASGDFRISRVGLLQAGTSVAAADYDVVHTLLAKPASPPYVVFDDENNDGKPTEPEEVYLTMGGSAVPQINDLHLSQVGSASNRYFYDLNVVIWYGA